MDPLLVILIELSVSLGTADNFYGEVKFVSEETIEEFGSGSSDAWRCYGMFLYF